MDALFTNPNSSAKSRDILKGWVRESYKFKTTRNQVYKTKIMCVGLLGLDLGSELISQTNPILLALFTIFHKA